MTGTPAEPDDPSQRPPGPGSEPAGREPANRARASVLRGIVIAAGVWQVIGFGGAYWAGRVAGTKRQCFSQGMAVARLELELRCAGVRRYAARSGRLPTSLRECEADTPELFQVEEAVQASSDLHWQLGLAMAEPWWLAQRYPDDPRSRDLPKPPPTSLDLFGLPVLYRPGQSAVSGPSWIHSSARFSPEVETYLTKHGGVPPEPPKPFAVGSLFVASCERDQRSLDLVSLLWHFAYLGGFAIVGVVGMRCLRRAGNERLSRWQRTGVGATALATAFIALSGSSILVATCYAAVPFHSTMLTKADRLALLESAVSRGEVPNHVAELARRFINGLPGNQE